MENNEWHPSKTMITDYKAWSGFNSEDMKSMPAKEILQQSLEWFPNVQNQELEFLLM